MNLMTYFFNNNAEEDASAVDKVTLNRIIGLVWSGEEDDSKKMMKHI